MPKYLQLTVLLGSVLAGPLYQVAAADHDFSAFNSIGRYLGIGYTRGGYHAAYDGRPDLVTNRHPASAYRTGGLPYNPAQAYYSGYPQGVVASPAPTVAPQGNRPQATLQILPGQAKPSASPAQPSAEKVQPPGPVAPANPTEPPPNWLKDYLKQEPVESTPGAASSSDSLRGSDNLLDSQSPSSPGDLLLEEQAADNLLPSLGVTYTIMERPAANPAAPPLLTPSVSSGNRYLSPPRLPR